MRYTTEKFIRKVKVIHGDRYDYSLVKYNGYYNKVNIICPIHGIFQQKPSEHLNGKGCPKCGKESEKKKKRYTTDYFIEISSKIHNNKYNYSLTDYVNSREKVKIICPVHGVFEQNPRKHMKGSGCPKCMGRIFDKNDFINRSVAIHGDLYDYSKVNYINAETKVCITCKKHGDFWMKPDHHFHGQKCPKCQREKVTNSQRYDTRTFIIKAKRVHGDKYDYSKVKYVDSNTNVVITCNKHGDFKQLPSNHLMGVECPQCAKESVALKQTYDTPKFIELAQKVHGDLYDYSLVEYKNYNEDVIIICKKHGEYKQAPFRHLSGKGCPICKASKGEKRIKEFLDNNKILYKAEYRLKNTNLFCSNNYFRVDFYLPSYQIIIEYNGIQHYESSDYFGGDLELEQRKERDFALKQFCKENKIELIEIPYTEFNNIESILRKQLKGKRKIRIPCHNTAM